MASHGHSGPAATAAPGSMHPAGPRTRWQKFRLVVKVVELRLRFVALMAITGLAFAYWDTLWNRYDKWMRPAAERRVAAAGIEHYCPMHPQVVQDEPGRCPICGMPLARRKKGERATLPAGVLSRVQLAPFQMAQAGVRVAEVGYAPLALTVTTVGEVAFDERRLAKIVSKVPGKTRVEKLYVNYQGMDVRAGEPLAELYSPELSQAIQELLLNAERAAIRPSTAAARSLLGDRRELVRLSAEKLKRWGITQAQIDDILKARRADSTIPVLSPITGNVVNKNVVEGQEVPESYPMFEVADLGRVWVKAQVFERQVDLVHEGQPVEATVDALPGRTFSGTVEFAQPRLDPTTRTVEVWYALDNPGHKLRPGMYATVTLTTPVAETPAFRARSAAARPSGAAVRKASRTAQEQRTCPVTGARLGTMGEPVAVEVERRMVWTCCDACPPKVKAHPAKYLARLAPPPRDEVLSVPESAVIDTGNRKVVYVEAGPGVFEGRRVVLGPRIGDRFPVLEGLSPGERVAADGAFLIDAESRLNPGVAPASPGGGPAKAVEAPTRVAAPAEDAHRH
jgi:membrane fusion protein, copper/silver efflux system